MLVSQFNTGTFRQDRGIFGGRLTTTRTSELHDLCYASYIHTRVDNNESYTEEGKKKKRRQNLALFAELRVRHNY